MTISTQSNGQHSLMKSFLMHVLPGVLATVVFLLLKPLLDSTGYPPLLAFLLVVVLVDLPVMLGVMLYEGKKLNGRYSLDGVVLYREKVPWMPWKITSPKPLIREMNDEKR